MDNNELIGALCHKIWELSLRDETDAPFLSGDEDCNEVHGMLADICDIVFDDEERAATHGYDGVIEKVRELKRSAPDALLDAMMEIWRCVKRADDTNRGSWSKVVDRVKELKEKELSNAIQIPASNKAQRILIEICQILKTDDRPAVLGYEDVVDKVRALKERDEKD